VKVEEKKSSRNLETRKADEGLERSIVFGGRSRRGSGENKKSDKSMQDDATTKV